MLLLKCLTGSRLYGTHHDNSDYDWYEVHDKLTGYRQAKQTITGDQDVVKVGLTKWLLMCDKGVPQALEVMFAPDDRFEVDVLQSMRHTYRANVANAQRTYERTITSFTNSDDPKRQRHASRLRVNLNELVQTGRFDPTAPFT